MDEKAVKSNEKIKSPFIDFQKDLAHLINEHCLDNTCDTPDYVLAEFLTKTLITFEDIVKLRDAEMPNEELESNEEIKSELYQVQLLIGEGGISIHHEGSLEECLAAINKLAKDSGGMPEHQIISVLQRKTLGFTKMPPGAAD